MLNLHSNHNIAQALEQQPFVLVLLYDMHVVCNIMPTVENYCTIKEAIKQLRFHYDTQVKLISCSCLVKTTTQPRYSLLFSYICLKLCSNFT